MKLLCGNGLCTKTLISCSFVEFSVISWIVWLRILSKRSTKLHEISRSNTNHADLSWSASNRPTFCAKPIDEVGTDRMMHVLGRNSRHDLELHRPSIDVNAVRLLDA